ncbi:MAG: hypothetical protein ACOVNL_06830 [Prochlorococcaceae cyanobacterium]|jgi:hypothetical protein
MVPPLVCCGRTPAFRLGLTATATAQGLALALAAAPEGLARPVPLVVQPVGSRPQAPLSTPNRRPDWRPYGPLRIDWSAWKPLGGSLVAPTLNASGRTIHLSVNCAVGKINVAGANGAWRGWQAPQVAFERQLVKDACAARAGRG